MKRLVLLIGCVILLWCFCGVSWADTDSQIADAIYLAEGGAKAVVPYGILSVHVRDAAEARRVCLNTIRNNRKRYARYGHKQYPDYLSFLASRYAPVNAHKLNKNWVKNVRYFLRKVK